MTSDTDTARGRRPASALGRKRDTERTDAILDAAGELLLEVGADGFRIQDVAERAGSGTGAIYRRWATKESLLAEAIRAMPDAEFPRTDDALGDLRATIELKFAAALEQPDLLPSMICAMRTDADISAAVDQCYAVDPLRAAISRVVGDDHPHLDLLAELAPALAIHRSTLGKNTRGHRSLTDDVMSLIEHFSHAES